MSKGATNSCYFFRCHVVYVKRQRASKRSQRNVAERFQEEKKNEKLFLGPRKLNINNTKHHYHCSHCIPPSLSLLLLCCFFFNKISICATRVKCCSLTTFAFDGCFTIMAKKLMFVLFYRKREKKNVI